MKDRTVTEEFLKEPFVFSDDYLFENLKHFHDRAETLHNITEDSSLRALHNAERSTMKLRFDLQDEMAKRLYRLFMQAAELGEEKYPIAYAMYPWFMDQNFPITLKETKNLFCQKNFYRWRCLDIWTYEPDEEDYDPEEEWPKNEPYLSFTVPYQLSYDEDDSLHFHVPWRWLKSTFLADHNSMMADAEFVVAYNRAKVKYEYDRLFDFGGHESPWSSEAMSKILLLVQKAGLVEDIETIRREFKGHEI